MLKKTLCVIGLSSVLLFVNCSYFKEKPELEVLSKRTFRTTVESTKFNCDSSIGEICDPYTSAVSDYVVKSIIGVRNRGGAGKIRAEVIIHTPEGQFHEQKIIEIKSGEDKTLEFIFRDVSGRGEAEKILTSGKSLEITDEFRWEVVSDDTPTASIK